MNLKDWCSQERGRASLLASVIGVPPSFMTQMVTGGRPVPPQHCPRLEKATGMQVRRWDMRPDDWHRIWPELLDAEGAPKPPLEAEQGA